MSAFIPESTNAPDRRDMVLVPRDAAERLLADLDARIEQASPSGVPVFDGIAELHDALGAEPPMGVTNNAILLLGYIAGAIYKLGDDRGYEIVSAGPGAGTAILRHAVSGNTFRVAVVQLEGTE